MSNESSFYEKVSPNIVRIGSSILSLNINFTKDPIIAVEAEFHSDDITKSRYYHEHQLHASFNDRKEIIIINTTCGSSTDVVEIIDLHKPVNKKILIPKSSETYCRHSDLSQFWCTQRHLFCSEPRNWHDYKYFRCNDLY